MWQTVSSRTRTNPTRVRNARARRSSLERLENRQLLSTAEFELSSLLPANGGEGFVVNGNVENGRLGNPRFSYESVGDVNQDGIDDLLLAAAGNSSTASDAYLIYGLPGGFPAELDLNTLDGTTGYRIHDAVLGNFTGSRGGGAGDLNHDGFPDLVLGAGAASPSSDRLGAGQSFVIYGGSANLAALDLADGTRDGRIQLQMLDGAHGFVINGVTAADGAGRSVGAGDVNGDHIDDLIIGASAGVNPGRAYVVFGRDSTVGQVFPPVFELASLNGPNGFVIPALQTTPSSFGNAGRAGDINGDGIGDIVLGHYLYAPSTSLNYAGQAYVIFGRASFPATFNLGSLNGSNGFTVTGAAAGDFLGYNVTGVGDVNGDGFDDVAIGASLAANPAGVRNGAAYIIFGKTGAFPAVIQGPALNGSNGFTLFDTGSCLSEAGDVNGDGVDDVIVGASGADPNGITDAGQSYVLYGRPSFGAGLSVASLLTANGGDGSAGFALNGFLTAQNIRPAGIGDINGDGFNDIRIGAETDDPNGLTDAGRAFIVYGKPSPPPTTRFYVVNDAAGDRTYEYTTTGTTVENYVIDSGDTAPRGAASTAAGDKVWVVDANKKVYVYNTSGGLLGSWTAGSLASNATVEGITTNGTDVWIVDARSDKVFRYTGAATRLSGSQNAASSFNLNGGNSSPKDIVTDGSSLWVVNDSSTDKVFKYNLSGSLLGSWTITGAGSSPTGITLDPSSVNHLWIVDSGTDRVYQFDAAAGRVSGSQSPSTYFALAAGNTNPQGIADPPTAVPGAGRAAIPFSTPRHMPRPNRSRPPLMVSPPQVSDPPSEHDLTLLAAERLRRAGNRVRALSRG